MDSCSSPYIMHNDVVFCMSVQFRFPVNNPKEKAAGPPAVLSSPDETAESMLNVAFNPSRMKNESVINNSRNCK